ncbi:MAG TPA: polysaccharide deacetylase family protein [Thermoanaerobaculia bacterium]|nr:polysaccharide deacetylase family protein [Thermoanaerobaculia bacterium]
MNRFALFRPLPIDENYILSFVVWLVAGCYVSALIPNVFGVLVGFLAAPFLLQIPLYATAPFFAANRPHYEANSRILFTLLLLASAWLAASHSWVRFVAWGFIALFAINVIAKLITEPIALLVPTNEWLGPVVSRFETEEKQVWLTIDDGPTDDTHALLDLLDKRRVRATFFVKGKLATPELIAAIVARGHTIGNHTQNHPSGTFWCSSRDTTAREIDDCAARIPPTPLFRAPVGHKNRHLKGLLAERHMKLIAFSARAYDAVVRDPRKIANTIAKRLEPGAIVVLHQGRAWSLDAIAQTIDAIRERGYSFVIPSL